MYGERNAFIFGLLKQIPVFRSRVQCLCACKINCYHSPIFHQVLLGQCKSLLICSLVVFSAHHAENQVDLQFCLFYSLQGGSDCIFLSHAIVGMQLWSKTDLGIDHTLGPDVLRNKAHGFCQGLFGLHKGQRECKALQKIIQTCTVRRDGQHPLQLFITVWNLNILHLCKLTGNVHRHRTIKMQMEVYVLFAISVFLSD